MSETLGLGKNEEKYILGFDLGYGDVKNILMTKSGEIVKKFKYPSVVGVTKKIPEVINNKIKEYNGAYFLIGQDTVHLPSENLIDIAEYKNLEYYAPLFLRHSIEICGVEPDIVITGLSIAQLGNSGYFLKKLSNFDVDGVSYNYKVNVLPQTSGIKIFCDHFFDSLTNKSTVYLGESNYIIVDIGFNTLDTLLCSRNKSVSEGFRAFEHEGLMKIASALAKQIKEDFDRDITLAEAKEILDTGKYKLRGKSHDYTAKVKEVKKEYLKNILSLLENQYGKILDKQDFVYLAGGGSSLFKTTEDNFIKVPKDNHEYGNAVGWAIYGKDKLED